MRLSAKLNLFLGVPFLNDDLLPERLGHLKSYFSCRPMNAFFPVAVTASTILATLLAVRALEARTEFGTTAFLLLATLAALARARTLVHGRSGAGTRHLGMEHGLARPQMRARGKIASSRPPRA